MMEESEITIGEYGRKRLKYLKSNRKGFYRQLLLEGKLTVHLEDVERRSQKVLVSLMDRINRNDPPPDRDVDYMKWVGHMNMSKLMAEEVIDHRIIYAEEFQDA